MWPLSVLSALSSYDNCAASHDDSSSYTRPCVCRKPNWLLCRVEDCRLLCGTDQQTATVVSSACDKHTDECSYLNRRGMWRSCRIWKEHLALTAVTCCQHVLKAAASHLEHTQVRSSAAASVLAKRAALAGRCRPSLVQAMCPGFQVSVQHDSWIPVFIVSTRLRCSWPRAPALHRSRPSRLSPCHAGPIRVTRICIRWPNHLELSSFQSRRQ